MVKRPSLADSMRAIAAPMGAPPPVRGGATARAGKKKVTTHVAPDVHTQLKQLALDNQTSTEALVVEALHDLFVKYGPRSRR